jgi:hypothetical protein
MNLLNLQRFIFFLFTLSLLAWLPKSEAHHSFAAEFDANKIINLNGVVTKVSWTNPHVWIYLNVKDPASGKIVNWGAELGPPHYLQRRGWRRETLKIGTPVDIEGFMSRSGKEYVNVRSVSLSVSGEILDGGSSQLEQGYNPSDNNEYVPQN